MKYLALFLLFISVPAFADEVRVYTDYSPVRVLKLIDPKADFEIEADKAGLKGNFRQMEESDLPKTRDDRNAWKLKSGSVSADKSLKDEIQAEKQKKVDAIEKMKGLGLTDDDLTALGIGA